jgi:mRNA interferase YafQ
MRNPVYSTQFKKDFKRCQKRGYPMQKLIDIMLDLESETPLKPQQMEHPLIGDYVGSLECHVEHDWLLVYKIDDDAEDKEVYFVRTGTHSDLF